MAPTAGCGKNWPVSASMSPEGKRLMNAPIPYPCRCRVMGVLNVTPDSFSDGGMYTDVEAAVSHGIDMARQGAAVIDVGPESTRPGARPVDARAQIERAVPVIERLIREIGIPISIDTCNRDVAAAALTAGASIVNDITALGDDGMAEVAARYGASVVLMHMQGKPATMQNQPRYRDVVGEVRDYLVGRAQKAEGWGIARRHIWIDPGIGFGKTLEHNLALLNHIDVLVETGYPVLVGASRKRTIGDLTGKKDPKDRVFGTCATVAHCAARGAAMVRVHDVDAAVDTIRVIEAITKY